MKNGSWSQSKQLRASVQFTYTPRTYANKPTLQSQFPIEKSSYRRSPSFDEFDLMMMSFNGSCWNKNWRYIQVYPGYTFRMVPTIRGCLQGLALMVFYVYVVLYEVYYITSRSYLLIAIFAIRRTQLFHQRWMILTARTSIFNRNSSRSNIWFAATCMGFGKHKPNHAVGLGCRASFISRSLSRIWYFMLCIPWSHSSLHVHLQIYTWSHLIRRPF